MDETALTAMATASIEKYCPHKPWPKQQFVLDLQAREIFFGGAKGPGKTDLLLMVALRYTHVPGYACLILRNSTREAKQANSILDRLYQWTSQTDVKWNLTDNSARFPSGAMIKFGYIDNPRDAYQYQSSEYQTIIWDELTQFRLPVSDGVAAENNPYEFMFGMNRKPEIGCHPWLSTVPCQVISASNPGGVSHDYVRRRFVTDEAIAAIGDPTPRAFYADERKTRCFVPALIGDNPAINAEEYIRESLMHLPPIARERYIHGDWSVMEGTIIDCSWLRYYQTRGEILVALSREQAEVVEVDCRKMQRFATIDTAGTSEEKARDAKGKPPSWSVIAVWDYHSPSDFLFLRHVWRGRVEWPDLKREAKEIVTAHRVPRAVIENKITGKALGSELRGVCAIEMYNDSGRKNMSVTAKVERSYELQNRLEAGKFFLPLYETTWRPEFEGELLRWTGLAEETDDQIDVASIASIVVKKQGQAWGGVVGAPSNNRMANIYR